jgi:uncharacterized integral membrane protein
MSYNPMPPLGQAVMASSLPVVIASNQTAVPVSGTFWQATQPVSGTITANIGTLNGIATEVTLAALNAKFGALGQAAMAASAPVVIASNQSAIPVTGTFWQATQPVSIATAPVLVAGSAIIGKVGIDQTTPGTTNAVVHPNKTQAAATITAADAVVGAPAGAGLLVTGASTAGSIHAMPLIGGESAVDVVLSGGNSTGVFYFEVATNSTDGTDGSWASVQALRLGMGAPAFVIGHTAAGALGAGAKYRIPVSGATYVRVRLVGAWTSATTVKMVASHAPDAVSIAGPVPTTAVNPAATYRGRCSTFRTPGIAGTAGQKIFAIHNATGSTKLVKVNKIRVDLTCTVVKAVTVLPPVVRVHRVTVLPTNGTAGSKVAKDSALSSSASVTVFQGASADGTASGTALTATIPAGSCIDEEFAPRLITAAGYEMSDRMEFDFHDDEIVLRALEGIVVFLDYTLATQNPTTDMWTVMCDWDEF